MNSFHFYLKKLKGLIRFYNNLIKYQDPNSYVNNGRYDTKSQLQEIVDHSYV